MKKPRYADADEEFREKFREPLLDEKEEQEYQFSRKYSQANRWSLLMVGSAVMILASYVGYRLICFASSYRDRIETSKMLFSHPMGLNQQ